MSLAAALNTAKSFVINKLTEENPDGLYIGNKPNDYEYFQCDLSDMPTTEDAENLRSYHQTNIYVEGLNDFHHPMGGMYSNIHNFKLSANLPQSFQYSFGGQWEAPLDGWQMDSKMNMLVQAGSSTIGTAAQSAMDRLTGLFGLESYNAGQVVTDNFSSLSNLTTTCLVWTKPNPMEIHLTIPVFDDRTALEGYESNGYKTDLREALNLLSNLALPSLPDGNASGFLVPPPTPLQIPLANLATWNMATTVMMRIQIGGMLALNQCALTNVTVAYEKTRSLVKQKDIFGNTYLSPLFASLNLTFKTVLGMTSLEMGNMLYLQTPPTKRLNLSKTVEDVIKDPEGAVKKAVTNLSNSVKNGFK